MNEPLAPRTRRAFLPCCALIILASCDGPLPMGDPARGAALFAQGDGAGPACQQCHCPDASGGCLLGAPNIQGTGFNEINARTRDPNVEHPGGKFDFTEEDIHDIAAFLAEAAPGP